MANTLTFLYYVNRLCNKLNEVPLTSTTFAGAIGVYSEFMNAVNAAISDIVLNEDDEWPFLWITTSMSTTIGVNQYSAPTAALKLDWDSFFIQRPIVTFTTHLTQTGGLATATLPAAYQGAIITGDTVIIQGSTGAKYDGTFVVTAPNTATFTFPVPLTTPATDTSSITQFVSPVSTFKLPWIDYDAYREEGYLNTDGEAYAPGYYGPPRIVARRKDNNFLFSPKPDRVYTIPFDYYTTQTLMTTWSDTSVIPDIWREVIVNGAMYYAYKFRDNTEEATAQQKDFENSLNTMRRILIPQPGFMRIDPSMRLNSSGIVGSFGS